MLTNFCTCTLLFMSTSNIIQDVLELLKNACSRKMHVLAINELNLHVHTCRWIATSDAWPVTRLLCCSVVSLPFAQMFSRTFWTLFLQWKCIREHHYALSQHRKQETSACPTSFCDQGSRDKGIQSSAILFPAHILMSSNLSLNL